MKRYCNANRSVSYLLIIYYNNILADIPLYGTIYIFHKLKDQSKKKKITKISLSEFQYVNNFHTTRFRPNTYEYISLLLQNIN